MIQIYDRTKCLLINKLYILISDYQLQPQYALEIFSTSEKNVAYSEKKK